MADGKTLALVGGVLVLLAAATGIGQFLKLYPESGLNPAVVRSFNSRLRAWWLMCSVLAAALLIGNTATVILFGAISFWALREFITLTPTRLGDHKALFWVFVLFTPGQYVLIGLMRHPEYELYNVLIPVYAFLFVLARVAVAGDYKRFLERTAKIQAGLLICVYCLSFAPALLYLDLKPAESPGANFRLLFFLILMVQVSDALHFFWSRLVGRHVIAPAISPSKTWEGFLGGTASATLLGTALWWATPFEQPWGAAGISLLISVMGFAGSMTMSAIKRDRGVKDYGTLVEGHGGVLDRIDSLCFAAPVVFHVMRFVFPLQQP